MVSDVGKQILAGLAETRRFFGQISVLVQTVDGMLGEAGWECVSTNKCTDITSHILRSQQWMPQSIYRFYRLADSEGAEVGKDIALFLGVLLGEEQPQIGFLEPWLTFGLHQFATGHSMQGIKYNEWIQPLENQHNPDGGFQSENLGNNPQENDGLVHYSVAAVTLFSIQNSEDLNSKVIAPLLKRFQNKVEEQEI
ncbi:MAG: hypothetical protein BZY75_00930 [SAR202 cluster bacterium Io17-Chloro-G7]|nr:MAG: hypothetical protein BZY75_00930 [SAR202 cluster bacterium Io17-Chloro-G7]